MIVKICGLTRTEDAIAAVEAGADMIGFVLAPSPRRVTPENAAAMIGAARSAAVRRSAAPGARALLAVGVFVDEKPDTVAWMAKALGLDLVQLHGNESPTYCASMPVGVIKAFLVKDEGSLDGLEGYAGVVDYVLLDTYLSGRAGGTGQSFDWSIAAGMEGHPVPWLLAGGLTPATVGEAARRCRPHGVDVSGGVEVRPGVKDHGLIRQFIANAKGGCRV